ncbi:hypothetical protein C8R45DRAFT_1091150 [Mycena sanguinolenta]|nr:hypothetical protein C8R45DRAFT_1091150 [Mycena sanguinolenta]
MPWVTPELKPRRTRGSTKPTPDWLPMAGQFSAPTHAYLSADITLPVQRKYPLLSFPCHDRRGLSLTLCPPRRADVELPPLSDAKTDRYRTTTDLDIIPPAANDALSPPRAPHTHAYQISPWLDLEAKTLVPTAFFDSPATLLRHSDSRNPERHVPRLGGGNLCRGVPCPRPASKAKKGKGKAKVTRKRVIEEVTEDSEADNDPFLAADIAAAKAASLGLPAVLDNATPGASSSSSRVPPPSGPASPPKRARSNSAGDVIPTRSYANTTSSGPSPFLVPVTVEAPATSTITASTPQPAAARASGQMAPAMPVAVAHSALAAQMAPAAPVMPTATAHAASAVIAVLAPVPPVVPPLAPPAAAAPAPAPAMHAQAPPAPPAPPMPAVAMQPPAAAAPLPPMWITVDGLPPRGSYMPTPAEGFPHIVYSWDHLTQGMSEGLRSLHDAVPHPKFYVIVSGRNGAAMRTHGLIRQALGNYLNIDPTSVQLGTPPTPENGPSPMLWLVAGIAAPLAEAALAKPVLASEAITLYPIPYEIPIIGFIGTFIGFTLPATQDGADTTCNLITTTICADAVLSQFVQTHHDAFGPHVSAEQAWDAFLSSVYVHSIVLTINDTEVVTWQLHVTSPTHEHVVWSQIVRLFGCLNIMTALHGTARLQRGYRICPSIAHPTGLCPFPNLPGWISPKPSTIATLEEASRQAAMKAQAAMRGTSTTTAGPSNSHPTPGRNQGPMNGGKPRKDGKGKKGVDTKGKGKRREFDDFL